MHTPAAQTIAALHAAYGQLTGLNLRLDMARERQWFDWLARGFTEADLRAVIAHIQRGIRSGDRRQGALKFSNLIGMPDYFEEDLAMARKVQRPPPPRPSAPLAAALRATGRPAAPPLPPAKTSAEILAGYAALKKALASPSTESSCSKSKGVICNP